MKKALSIVMAATMVLSLTACGGSSQTSATTAASAAATEAAAAEAPAAPDKVYEVKMASLNAVEATETVYLQRAVDRINEETNGGIHMTLYPSGQLGDYTQIYDEVMEGTIEMCMISPNGSYDILQEAAYLPFLLDDFEDYHTFFDEGGLIFERLTESHEKLGITNIAFYPGGFLGLAYTDMKGMTPEVLFDPTSKKSGMLRIPAMEYVMKTLTAMNFNVTPINYSDVYTALQTGIVDGSWHASPYINYISYRDVIKYFANIRAIADGYVVMGNTEFLNSLPQEYRDTIINVIQEEMKQATAQCEAEEEEYLKKMEEYGIEVWTPTEEQRDNMKNFVIENVWPVLAEDYGEDFIAELTDYVRNKQ